MKKRQTAQHACVDNTGSLEYFMLAPVHTRSSSHAFELNSVFCLFYRWWDTIPSTTTTTTTTISCSRRHELDRQQKQLPDAFTFFIFLPTHKTLIRVSVANGFCVVGIDVVEVDVPSPQHKQRYGEKSARQWRVLVAYTQSMLVTRHYKTQR